jgi:hypothetical protein
MNNKFCDKLEGEGVGDEKKKKNTNLTITN